MAVKTLEGASFIWQAWRSRRSREDDEWAALGREMLTGRGRDMLWEILLDLAIVVRVLLKKHGGHGQVRIDLVIVDTADGSDVDRLDGPVVTI